ncbi:MAG: agmatine deiminase family protein, partial [Bacteroidota bacterium]
MPNIKFSFILFLSLFWVGCTKHAESNDRFYMPAEFEEQEAIWLNWSPFSPYQQPFGDLVAALAPITPLQIIYSEQKDSLIALLKRYEIDTSHIQFHQMPDSRLWVRDHGATFLIDGKGKKAVLDFGWTFYGYRDLLEKRYPNQADTVAAYYQKALGETGQIDRLMGKAGRLPVIKSKVNLEGGS